MEQTNIGQVVVGQQLLPDWYSDSQFWAFHSGFPGIYPSPFPRTNSLNWIEPQPSIETILGIVPSSTIIRCSGVPVHYRSELNLTGAGR